ncbi:CbbQ/NirQ/NorQ/GpvN family protein [Marivita sp. XM-24bin2]|jgi:nitric oxide reductase NorQ protein|uniref:CbbQ/NirQ/NorQ/GpvN family protein n=1 Tax=unclassified Marivita TaxID=2632480 RepID=UPI000D7AEAD5|nr:CbbQ/NirQ/NorQ/GpvN family protein [Marivita sp. XM-24bin2]MCR9110717.1 CbbQ/NirQ/NorQ/GpvN family protein [Paracoccaceae bacterium]PWL33394.1 MAG: AAA family ATPase [Marivita sp. XM-24bin2]
MNLQVKLSLPFYQPTGRECDLFETAHDNGLPLLLKGPTGCGKTRFVEHMAARLGKPLYTVACHDDLSAADLIGRYLLKGGETVWVDGPLTRAVREGGICYLDEVVEARKDVTVVLHPLTDTRRTLMIDRTGEELMAPKDFMLVASYNPGYQNVLKRLKPSTRQRFLSISFDFPDAETEIAVVSQESRLEVGRVAPLVRLGGHIRNLSGMDLEEGVSTRLLIYAATLMAGGMGVDQALEAAVIEPLSDEPDVQQALRDLISTVYG